jgi:hypothetical protein
MSFMTGLGASDGHVISCTAPAAGKSAVVGVFCATELYPPVVPAKGGVVFVGVCTELSIKSFEYREESSVSRKGFPGSLKRMGSIPVLYLWP